MTGAWQVIALLAALAIAVLFVRSRFTGELPKQTAVRQETLQLEDAAGAIAIHVWRPHAPAGPTKLPLLLYAPHWGGRATDSGLLVADLASRGYVIVGFDDVAHDPTESNASSEDEAARAAVIDLSSQAALEHTLRIGASRVRLEARKAHRVLDAVLRLVGQAEGPWGQVDAARVGFLGYSFGGATAAQASLSDPRIKAAANLDGAVFGEAAQRGPRSPYLLVSSSEEFPPERDLRAEGWRRFNALWAQRDRASHERGLGDPGYHWLLVEDALHTDFSNDLFAPGTRDAFRRSWSARRAQRAAVSDVLGAFFDAYVAGRGSSLAAPAGTRWIERSG